MTEPLGNSIATSQPRELNATEIEAVGGAIGPLVAGLLAFDLFGIGVNIGLWAPELSKPALTVTNGKVTFLGTTVN